MHLAGQSGRCAGGLGVDVESAPIAGPQGCLGYAFDLVRPVRAGGRVRSLFNKLCLTVVFRTVAEASVYRLGIAKETKCDLGQNWLDSMYTC